MLLNSLKLKSLACNKTAYEAMYVTGIDPVMLQNSELKTATLDDDRRLTISDNFV